METTTVEEIMTKTDMIREVKISLFFSFNFLISKPPFSVQKPFYKSATPLIIGLQALSPYQIAKNFIKGTPRYNIKKTEQNLCMPNSDLPDTQACMSHVLT